MTDGEFGSEKLDSSFDLPSDTDDKFAMKILDTLFTNKDLNFKTELSDREIKIMTRLTILADLMDLKALKEVVREFKELRVSKQRAGRNELVSALVKAQQEKGINRIDAIKGAFNL